MRTCTYLNCQERHFAQGYCSKHYRQYRRTGSPHRTFCETLNERLDKYHVKAPNGCWEWIGGKTHGYGMVRSSPTTTVQAHRASYERHIGPIPEGLHVDHLCANRACINPAHLEPVTMQENIKRGGQPHMAVAA